MFIKVNFQNKVQKQNKKLNLIQLNRVIIIHVIVKKSLKKVNYWNSIMKWLLTNKKTLFWIVLFNYYLKRVADDWSNAKRSTTKRSNAERSNAKRSKSQKIQLRKIERRKIERWFTDTQFTDTQSTDTPVHRHPLHRQPVR